MPILIQCYRPGGTSIDLNRNTQVFILNTNFGPSAEKYVKDNKENALFIYGLFLIEVLKLHRKGYAHLDLKPANFCVKEEPDRSIKVNLIDFGSAIGPFQNYYESHDITNKKGTLGFNTKEQFDGEKYTMKELQQMDIFACRRIFTYFFGDEELQLKLEDTIKNNIAQKLGIDKLSEEFDIIQQYNNKI